MTLWELPVGGAGQVAAVTTRGAMGQRLTELGFVPGAQVSCLFESPWHDPRAYQVCGAVIALRRADARGILMKGGQPR